MRKSEIIGLVLIGLLLAGASIFPMVQTKVRQKKQLKAAVEYVAEHPVIEMYNAVNDAVAGYINNPMKEGYNNGASWTQTREQIRAAVQAELDDANEKLSKVS